MFFSLFLFLLNEELAPLSVVARIIYSALPIYRRD